MKMATVYINKSYIAEKLGIDESKFVFGDIQGDSREIQFNVFIESDAEVKGSLDISEGDDWTVPRQLLDDIGS